MTDEKHYTPQQLAEAWCLSLKAIRTLFRDEPGVLVLERPETRHKRGYATLRIPASVADRVHLRLRNRGKK